MANHSTPNKKKTTVAGVVIALLIGGYSLARQPINDAMGWHLPAVPQQSEAKPQTQPQVVSSLPAETKSKPPVVTAEKTPAEKNSPATNSEKTKPAETKPAASKPAAVKPATRGPLADRMASAKSDVKADEKAEPKAAATADTKPDDDPSLKYGVLREIGNERYISPAGLLYTPGSAEGHRLEHLRRHTEDQPSRPGKHGVFDGGMEGALKTIEQAYENAKAGKRTSERTDQGRTIYTVDMGKRVGYIGGREGNQRRKPMARRVQIVLEGNRVITAYPL
jgi:hypothetical protein